MAARLSGAVVAALGAFPDPAQLEHPVFDPLRPALAALAGEGVWPDCQRLNALADELGRAPRNARGLPIRFVEPGDGAASYEALIDATGRVPTRPRNLHDLFNALVWLSFPRLKAALNALHADEIPREGGRRGPFRDLLTLVDEGGALVACADPPLAGLVRAHRWKSVFWDQRARITRSMRIAVVGHAVLEKALDPWPGLTCKALFVDVAHALIEAPPADLYAHLDERATEWLADLPRTATPRVLPPLPVFGYPGWFPGNDAAAFYTDERYFRPFPEKRARPQHTRAA